MNLCKECGINEKAPGRSRCWACYSAYRRGEPKINYTAPTNMKILMLDIETSPHIVYTWDFYNTNIGVEQVIQPGGMLCFAGSWYGDNDPESVMFFHGREDRLQMIEAAWKLLDEADVLIHYYGSRFDVLHLQREFVENGFPPPSPFKQIDLKKVVSKQFYFPSNKLQYVSKRLGQRGKEEHEGFPLWKKCLDGDDDAWARMESYNRQDVVLLEDLYETLLPWIPNHPSRWLYEDGVGCPTCGHGKLEEAGFAYTRVSKFQQYRCTGCGGYFRDSRRIDGVDQQQSL